MDPITLMGTVTAAFNGLKAAVHVGQEIEQVYTQLSKWADAAGQLQQLINDQKNDNGEQKLGLFEKIGFKQSETSEAFDILIAQERLREMEGEIWHMFIYGELQHLGTEGYSNFIQLRRDVREKRERMIRDQIKRRKRFIENCFWSSLLLIALFFTYQFFVWIFDLGREAGKW